MPLGFQEFKEKAARLAGIDLSCYKSVQMDRRIQSLMASWDIQDYDEYYHVLQTNTAKYQEFVKKLTINVSEFFRNPERFAELREKILPEIAAKNSFITIWSAGCSNGSEPYTIGIILREMGLARRSKIIATDIDKVILEKAKAARYNASELRNVAPELLNRYFKPEEERMFQLGPEIQQMVEFRHHNLLHDPFPTGMDLILCRNVVIYFTEEAKKELYQKFYSALRLGGYLMVGGTEPLLSYRSLGFENPLSFFYRKGSTVEGSTGF